MMALILKFSLLLCALMSWANASPKVLSMPMYRQERSILPKRSPFPVTIVNTVSEYYVNAYVGTPPQLVQLQIDTGSSDVWVLGPQACDVSSPQCSGGRTFDSSKSSTFKLLEAGLFKISYVTPGSMVFGDYIADNFAIGGVTIKNLIMGRATKAVDVIPGIMGIGFDINESIVGNGGQPYPNIIDAMVLEGIISSRSYSLWLDDLKDASGTALFGGYDTAKFSGQLSILPIQPSGGVFSEMAVLWSSITVTDSHGTTQVTPGQFQFAAILDSGTTLTLLPPNIFNPLANYFGAVFSDKLGAYLVPCKIGSIKGTLDYGFGGRGGPVISVSFSELALPLIDNMGNPLTTTFPDGSLACQFGLDVAPDSETILFGDTFLRSAYVVYDLDRLQISIAPTVFESNSSNIVEIGPVNGGGVSKTASTVSVSQTPTSNVVPSSMQSRSTNVVSSSMQSRSTNVVSSSMQSRSTNVVSSSVQSRSTTSAIIPTTVQTVYSGSATTRMMTSSVPTMSASRSTASMAWSY